MKEKKDKVKFSFKDLTKKQIVLIVIAVAVLCAAIALSIALPLTLARPAVAAPAFDTFDPQNDTDISVKWDKVRGAKSYTVEYCFGARTAANIHSATTSGNKFFAERKIGVVSVRVKAETGKDATFSDWISMDVPAYKLADPTVVVDSSLRVGWADVTFPYRGKNYKAYQYSFAYKMTVEGEEAAYSSFPSQSKNNVDLKAFVVGYVSSFYEPGLTEWQDVTLKVKVGTLTTLPSMIYASELTDYEKFLTNACEQSDVTEATFVITKEIYEGLI